MVQASSHPMVLGQGLQLWGLTRAVMAASEPQRGPRLARLCVGAIEPPWFVSRSDVCYPAQPSAHTAATCTRVALCTVFASEPFICCWPRGALRAVALRRPQVLGCRHLWVVCPGGVQVLQLFTVSSVVFWLLCPMLSETLWAFELWASLLALGSVPRMAPTALPRRPPSTIQT